MFTLWNRKHFQSFQYLETDGSGLTQKIGRNNVQAVHLNVNRALQELSLYLQNIDQLYHSGSLS